MADLYVHNNAKGDGIAMHMQEGMENWIGLIKQLAGDHIKPNGAWLARLLRYIDLYVIAGIEENIVDFRISLMKAKKYTNLIWDDETTPDIIFAVENSLPINCRKCLVLIDQIQFG